MANEEYLSEQEAWIGVLEKSCVKGVLVEENSARVLGDHVEDLRQGTVGDKACTLLYADHMPRAIKVSSQKQGSDPRGPKFQERTWSSSVCRLLR